MNARLGVLIALCLSLASPVSGQSLLSIQGSGLPVAGVDARARALGGVGVGLTGPQLTATDPAAATDLIAPIVVFAYEGSSASVAENGSGGDFNAHRFPLVGVSYPVPSFGVVSVTFSSLLDQEWQNEQSLTLDLDGSGGQALVTDVFASAGGLSALEVGVARRFGSISVGARAGRYLGSLQRTLTRSFDSLTVGTAPTPFQTGGLWRYSGFTGIVGASAPVGAIGHLAVSYRLGGTATATPSDDTQGAGSELTVPAELRLGGSVLLSPLLTASAGFERSDWSDASATGRSGWAVGGGVEWAGARILGKDGALRLGARRASLPFVPSGSDSATESFFSGGVGIGLVESDSGLLGAVDFGFELGSRSFGTTSEDLFRTSISLRLSGL